MICERFSFIIICSILSNLPINSSWATTPNMTAANLVKNVAIAPLNQNSPSHRLLRRPKEYRSSYKTTETTQIVSQSELKPDLSGNSSNAETSSEINRFWLLVAMTATSFVSLFLLWNLFRKPLPSQEVVVTSTEATAQSDIQEVISNSGRSELVQEEQITTSKVSSANNLLKEIENTPQDEPIIANSNTSNNISQESTVSIAENLSPSGNLVNINSGNDYIDVSFELIQDLRSCDRNIKRKAIWELAKIGDSRCIEPLIAIMPQAGAVDRSLILKAVTKITNRSFKLVNEQLFAELNDANPQVRINAILDLTDLYKFVAPINQQLSQMQLDSDQEVKHRAKQALEKLNLTNITNFVSLVNNYPTHVNGNVNGNMTLGDKNKANQSSSLFIDTNN